jgi:hypothetical protein
MTSQQLHGIVNGSKFSDELKVRHLMNKTLNVSSSNILLQFAFFPPLSRKQLPHEPLKSKTKLS